MIFQRKSPLEKLLQKVEDPLKKIPLMRKAGIEIDREVVDYISDPEKIGYNPRVICENLEILKKEGISFPAASVDTLLQKLHPRNFNHGIDNLRNFASVNTLKKTGILAYKYHINDFEKNKYEYLGYAYADVPAKLITEFNLAKEDILSDALRGLENSISFYHTHMYNRTLRTYDKWTKETVCQASAIRSVCDNLGITLEDAVPVIQNHISTVLQTKKPSEKTLENAFGMMIEFETLIPLEKNEQIQLAKLYLKTGYPKFELLKYYIPEEIRKIEESRKEAAWNNRFNYHHIDRRNELKGNSYFSDKRFIEYDRTLFDQNIKEGNIKDAYTIACEREYPEKEILAGLL